MKHCFKDYYIDRFDKLNYAIFQRKINSNSGAERFDALYYFSNLKSLNRYLKELYVGEELFNEEFESILDNLELLNEKIDGIN